jgi:hypothetical protein
MTDIVERLREIADSFGIDSRVADIRWAADEIERLRKIIKAYEDRDHAENRGAIIEALSKGK